MVRRKIGSTSADAKRPPRGFPGGLKEFQIATALGLIDNCRVAVSFNTGPAFTLPAPFYPNRPKSTGGFAGPKRYRQSPRPNPENFIAHRN